MFPYFMLDEADTEDLSDRDLYRHDYWDYISEWDGTYCEYNY